MRGRGQDSTSSLVLRTRSRLRKTAEPRYNTAARIVSDFRPNHREDDSSRPPSSEPNKFDPRALPRKPARAKLETKIMPAKKTGRQRASVAAIARTSHDAKNSFCIGMVNITTRERNKHA